MKFLPMLRWPLALVLAAGLTGCKPGEPARSDTPAAKAAAPAKSETAALAVPAEASAPVLQLDDDALPAATPADAAWREVLKIARAVENPDLPADWQLNPPSQAQIAAFEQQHGEVALRAADAARQFYMKFPQHAQAADARKQELALLNVAVQLGQTNRLADLQALEQARLKDPALPEDERFELAMQQAQRTVLARQTNDNAAMFQEMEKVARALQKDFPKRTEPHELLLSVAQGLLEGSEVEKSRSLTEEILKGAAPDEIKTAAKELLKKSGRLGQPLALKFTAVDGREVDLAKLKGRVVLVDFWATWCGPCVKELPNVKAAYQKLHDQGFEIVGVSLDNEKEALEEFVQSEKLPWPQYYEGRENKLATEFGIESIPTMWLVDRQGNLRELNARDKLAEKVAKLLAEK